jgi:hypothetical protein
MAKISILKNIHVIIHEDLRQAYVVPVYTKNGGIYFEMTPVTHVAFLHRLEDDLAALCNAMVDAIAQSAALISTPPVDEMARRWDGDHESAWIHAAYQIDIAWTDSFIRIEEREPVMTDAWYLPAMEAVASGRFSLSTEVHEIAEYILTEFVYTDQQSNSKSV